MLSWNSTDDTVACLSTLCPQLAPDDRVIVVDNGSTDDVKGAVLGVDPRTQFIQNGANLGFAEGNNVGLRVALETGTPWILVLNNDTLLDPDTLDQLLLGARRAGLGLPHGAGVAATGSPRVW